MALLAALVTYLVARDPDSRDPTVRAGGDTLASERTTTTSEAPTTTTTALAPSATTTVTPAVVPQSTVAQTPAPPFESSIEAVTLEQLGASWKPDLGCAAPEQLRAVNVSHWGYDGQVHLGRLVVAATHAERMVAAFRDIYAARFPIERMVPIDAYGGDDQASMRANNTSGFNCRTVAGSTKLSQHAFGLAIDVNPLVNPYVKGGGIVDPPEGAPYADRTRNDVGMIHSDDAAVRAFAAQGWRWGGYWSQGKDYQHFSASGG